MAEDIAQDKKKKIDVFLDMGKLEKILDEIVSEAEKSMPEKEKKFGFSISISDGKANFSNLSAGTAKEPAMEQVSEESSFRLVFDLVGITSSGQVQLKLGEKKVFLFAKSQNIEYYKEAEIPEGFSIEKESFNNGIFEVSFRKAGKTESIGK